MRLIIETFSGTETRKAGEIFAKEIIQRRNGLPIIIALNGDLGAGKTTFIKGFAKGLGIKENIVSPTFTLIQTYKLPTTSYKLQATFYHIDSYRLDNVDTIIPDIEEILKEKNAVVAIEWAERLDKILPSNTIWIELTHKGGDRREIKIKADYSVRRD